MRTWDAFYPDVLPDVLGCPELTAERHLLRAAQRFCRETRCWRDELDPIVTNATNNLYDLTWPDNAMGVELIAATLDGEDIALEVADGTTLGDRLKGMSGRKRVLTLDLATVTVLPKPSAGQRLVLSAILKPSEDAAGVPDAVADQHMQAIATGALSTLLAINKAAWANPGLSQVRAQEFQTKINDARSRSWKANTNRNPRVRGQFY